MLFMLCMFVLFVGMLELLRREPKAAGIPFVRLDGSMSQHAHAAMIQVGIAGTEYAALPLEREHEPACTCH